MEQTDGSSREFSVAMSGNLDDEQFVQSALLSYLQGNAGEDERFALVQACERPWGLIVIAQRQNRQSKEDNPLTFKRTAISNVTINYDSFTVVFLSYADIDHFIGEAIGKEADNCRMALSLPFKDLDSIPQQMRLAQYYLDSNNPSSEKSAQGKTLDFLKQLILENVDVDGLLHPALDKLANYDHANQSDMLKTLRVYLDNDRNAQRCANLLYLHRNSLQYRVRRIQEIADIDLDDPTERAYLRLSLFLRS